MTGRRASWAVGTALVVVLAVAPGCVVGDETVLVAGHDDTGTLVAGAVRCDGDRSWPVAGLAVAADDRGEGDAPELWRIEPADDLPSGSDPDGPAMVGRVPVVAVGDPDPAGATVVEPLAGELPDRLEVRAGPADDPLTVQVDRAALPNTYAVASVRRGSAGADAAGAAAEVDDICAGVGRFQVPRLLIYAALISVPGIVVAAVGVGAVLVLRRRRP